MLTLARKTVSALSVAALAACQSLAPQQAMQIELPELAANASDAEAVVDALARAERASDSGDLAELARQLTRLDMLGARFESEEDRRDVARWREQADMPPPMRGPVGGPAVRRGTLSPGSSMEFGQAFLAGERASLAIQAQSGPVIGISVADGQDETVCTRQSRRGSCMWTPVFTQRHTIRLTNNGTTHARYHLAIE